MEFGFQEYQAISSRDEKIDGWYDITIMSDIGISIILTQMTKMESYIILCNDMNNYQSDLY